MRRKMGIHVRGERHEWTFHFEGDPKHLDEWRTDGLDVHEIANAIPAWVVEAGLARVWVFCGDVFNFRNPFKS